MSLLLGLFARQLLHYMYKLADPSVLPSMCDAQKSATVKGGWCHSQKELLPMFPSTFTTITDTPEDPKPQVLINIHMVIAKGTYP